MALDIAESRRRMDILSKVVSRKLNVSAYVVEYGAAPAYMTKAKDKDGKDQIFISRKHFEELFDKVPGAERCVKGALFHEIGHAVYTDYIDEEVVNSLVKDKREAALLFNVINILEDIRIEFKIAAAYAGISSEMERFTANLLPAIQLKEGVPFTAILKSIFVKVRYPKLFAKHEHELEEMKLLPYHKKLVHYGYAAKACENTAEVIKLAVALLKDLAEFTKPAPPPPFGGKGKRKSTDKTSSESGDSEDGDDGEDGEDSEEGKDDDAGEKKGKKSKSKKSKKEKEPKEGKGKGAKEDDDEEAGDEPEDKGTEGAGDSKDDGDDDADEGGSDGDKGDEGEDGEGDSNPGELSYNDLTEGIEDEAGKDLSDIEREKKDKEALPKSDLAVDVGESVEWLIEKILAASAEKRAAEALPMTYPKLPVKLEIDLAGCYVIAPGATTTETKWPGGYDYPILDAANVVNTMVRRLKDAFVMTKLRRYQPNQRSGVKVTTKDLYKICVDDVKLFSRRLAEQDAEVEFSILVDLSGSMSDKMQMTRQSLMVMSKVLHSLNVPFEILGFTSRGASYGDARYAKDVEVRVDHIYHYIVKEFAERFDDKIKSRLGSLCQQSQNWDGEAILWAWKRLVRRTAKKRVLVVMSDGEPWGNSSQLANSLFTRRVVEKIEKEKKVSIIGVGIETDYVSKFYKDHVVINDVADMASSMVTVLRKHLLRRDR